jgi:predicted nucleotidyltransferase
MTTTSPSSTLEVSPDRPVHPVTIALLRHVRDAAQQLGSEFAVAGATARDIVLWHVYGIRAERATRDVDVAVCAVSWDAHRELTSQLEATGLFKLSERVEHSLVFEDASVGMLSPLDLVPFGPLEAPEGTIKWPKDKAEMNVLGFREAVDTALQVDIGESLTVPVVSLPALAILKLLAWQDRRTTKNTDAGDLLLVIRNYHNAGNNERIWEVATDLLKTHGFDADRAAAALLGRAARRIALPATRDAVVPLLVPGKVFETHSGDMLASAARRMFVDEFADTTVGSLAAFRDGFMQDPSDGIGAGELPPRE